MKNSFYLLGVLLMVLVGIMGYTSPAAAQCSGSMMGMCSGSENCHEPGEECTAQNCPEGMTGSCMDSTGCSGGMMGNCHEDSSSSCPMEECPMENCPMPEMCEMMGMMGGCGEMMGECCAQSTPGARRAWVRLHSSPNPFNPVTTLSFTLTEASNVDLRIFDISAREVANLATGLKSAGNHVVAFSAANLPAGIYFARLQIPASAASVQKLVLLK